MRQVVSCGSALTAPILALMLALTGGCGGDGPGTGPRSGDGGTEAGNNGGEADGGDSGGDDGGGNNDDGGGDDGGGNNGDGGGDGSTARPGCGNAAIDDGEDCDDGNQVSGDGCSDQCKLEDGYECPELGAGCELCGNGVNEDSEQCDDGNRDNGDGCDADCDIEQTAAGVWSCPVDNEPCELCGDGERDPNERCDDGNTMSGDGCGDMCRTVEEFYACDPAGGLCTLCGDSKREGAEVCDDGNRVSGDGCTGNCRAEEPGWSCPDAGGTCTLCGDGMVDDGEQCDDGNYRDNDGCTDCQLDEGATCLTEGSTCFVCGNGVIEPIVRDMMTTTEECDDGNRDATDGCDNDCVQDPAYECIQPGITCSLCGDGAVSGFESCDDGKHCTDNVDQLCTSDDDCTAGTCEPLGDDGCSASCQAETNFVCPPNGGACVECGNGIREGTEACDDGKHCSDDPSQSCDSDLDCVAGTCAPLGGDGCTRRCSAVEDDFQCLENADGLTVCASCGNGIVETVLDTNGTTELIAEACDDGNNVDDGCAADCSAITEGFNCFFPGFPCPQCGDGDVQPGEQCDEGENATGGCDDTCQVVDGYVCLVEGEACALCGDGQLDPLVEGCDDNNLVNGDGCSAECEIEDGYVCDEETGSCNQAAACGDGFRAGDEECDDGNNLAGDGCSFVCDVEDGFVCDTAGCRETACGDGVVEGDEECDIGSVCTSGGAENGLDCTASAAACEGEGGSCDPADSTGCIACQVQIGYECPPGMPCTATVCGDGEVRGAEQCDDSGRCSDDADQVCTSDEECVGTCDAQAGDGCDTSCQLEAGFHCPMPGMPCETTTCGDGLVQGLEACDDGNDVDGDGCSAACTVENLYTCTEEPSDCRPIIQFVAVRKFNVNNVSPSGLAYVPERRSFAGYKQSSSKPAIELCLDGTLLNEEDTTGGAFGTVYPPGCEEATCTEALPDAYEAPPRDTNIGQLAGATYDPFTGHVLFLESNGTLSEVPSHLADTTVDLVDLQQQMSTDIGNKPDGLTVGEDGNLYITSNNAGSQAVWVINRVPSTCIADDLDAGGGLCDKDSDCPSNVCAASFDATATGLVTWSHPVTTNLSAIFTVPGEGLLGTFAEPSSGAYSQCVGGTEDGTDCTADDTACVNGGGACDTLPQFSFWDPDLLPGTNPPLYERSTLPGLLFSFGLITDDQLPYGNQSEAASAETAADGGAFIICSRNSSAPCLLFGRGCRDDAECQAVQPGTTCVDPGNGGQPYCAAQGRAVDDRDTVGAEEQDAVIDVLANDTLSQSACVDPTLKVVALTGADGNIVYDRYCVGGTNAGANCTGEPFLCDGTCESNSGTLTPTEVTTEKGGTATITHGGADVTYDAPTDIQPTCGFVDSFEYTADLGGGVLDTATVRILVACVCGDGLVQGGEQCDCGTDALDLPGSCNTVNGGLPARCSDSCLLNIVCGDAIIDPGEQCDNGKHCSNDPMTACVDDADCGGEPCVPVSGDGCSARCTLESVCGNGGAPEGVEECDDGNTDSGDGCNANCTLPRCGDGVTDADGIDGVEQCDDGINNGPLPAACSATCQINAICGNGRIEGTEECDDGNTDSGDGCNDQCKVEGACGNGEIDTMLGEECDATAGGTQCGGFAACTARCLCENYCGDGRIGGSEECDDGKHCSNDSTMACSSDADCGGAACLPVSGDGCTDSCVEEYCGDGVRQPDLGEACDDGNTNPGDGCTNDCRSIAKCGNAILEPGEGEECDDGNNTNGDGCSSTCLEEGKVCGDGLAVHPEECDDGNTTSGDGCAADCTVEAAECGNSTLDPGEECDDGNTTSGDGCSSLCLNEVILN